MMPWNQVPTKLRQVDNGDSEALRKYGVLLISLISDQPHHECTDRDWKNGLCVAYPCDT